MTYEYLCKKCKHEWEIEQPIKDLPIKMCPKCNELFAVRQISKGNGFVLKGGRWASSGYS